eukprot:TRINITY_DN15340_c0_g1_i1.p1 TRINITY_DN15340_c0_g1~~TRINITY_DN15340_c0_g1_i1.p1  ORF type:complete len:332 (-),score=63.43 TRINITY_DN15340_c0_g1_i1:22-1017(-)
MEIENYVTPVYCLGDFPTKSDYWRAGHTLNYGNDKIYIFGGYNGLDKLYMLNGASKLGTDKEQYLEWKKFELQGFTPRAAHRSFYKSSNRKLYIHGGYDRKSNMLHDLVEVDLSKKGTPTSTVVPYTNVVQNVERRWHCLNYFDEEDKFFVHGGWNDGGALDDLLSFDMETKTWKNIEMNGLPSRRRHHSVCRVENQKKLLIFGGYNGDHDNPLDDVFEVDLNEGRCLKLMIGGEDNPGGRLRHSMTMINDKCALVLGGMNHKRNFAEDPYLLTLDDLKWHKINYNGSFYPIIRAEHQVVKVSDNKLFICGGYSHNRIHSVYHLDTRAFNY